MINSSRTKYIDCLKGLAIILVVMGHYCTIFPIKNTSFLGILMYFIYCFHMPLFFFLSGWSWNSSYNKIDLKNKIFKTIISCLNFVWVVILFGTIHTVIFNNFDIKNIINLLFSYATDYWYIVVLACIYCLLVFLKRNKLVLMITILVTFALGFINMSVAKFVLYLFFFLLGTLINEYQIEISKKESIISLLTFLAFSVIWYFVSGGNLLVDVYSKTICGITAILFLYYIFRNCKSNILALFGQNTLVIYLTHCWVSEFIINNKLINNIPKMIYYLLLLIIVLIFYYFISVLLNKMPIVKRILFKPFKIKRKEVCIK